MTKSRTFLITEMLTMAAIGEGGACCRVRSYYRSVGILIRRLHLHLCTSLFTELTDNLWDLLVTLFSANYHNEFDYDYNKVQD